MEVHSWAKSSFRPISTVIDSRIMDLSWLQEQSTSWEVLSVALMNITSALSNKLATVLFQGKAHYALLWNTRKISIQMVSLFSFFKPRWVIEMKEEDSVGCWSAFIHEALQSSENTDAISLATWNSKCEKVSQSHW